MEIKQFISQSIEQVVEGLLAAQTRVSIQGVDIKTSGGDLGYSEMDFDLAVTTRRDKDKGGDIGLSVLGVDVKLGKKDDLIHTVASRLKFSVPLWCASATRTILRKKSSVGAFRKSL